MHKKNHPQIVLIVIPECQMPVRDSRAGRFPPVYALAGHDLLGLVRTSVLHNPAPCPFPINIEW